MKVYHCKNQGVTRFSFEKPIVKLKVRIEIEQHYNDLCKRTGATLQIRIVKLQVQIRAEQPSHGWRKRSGATLQIE